MKTIKLFKITKGDTFKESVLCIRPILPRPNGLLEAVGKTYRIFDRSGYNPFGNHLVIYHPISLATKATWDTFDWVENENFIIHRHITLNWNSFKNATIDSINITEFNDFKYTVKYFQVRDRGMNLPTMCIKFDGDISSFSDSLKKDPMFCHFLEIQEGNFDSAAWEQIFRTKKVSHEYIDKHWSTLDNGAVIDVEYILGEKDMIKEFE